VLRGWPLDEQPAPPAACSIVEGLLLQQLLTHATAAAAGRWAHDARAHGSGRHDATPGTGISPLQRENTAGASRCPQGRGLKLQGVTPPRQQRQRRRCGVAVLPLGDGLTHGWGRLQDCVLLLCVAHQGACPSPRQAGLGALVCACTAAAAAAVWTPDSTVLAGWWWVTVRATRRDKELRLCRALLGRWGVLSAPSR
jgi:hypothetical protein